jgi:hypothetical protein
VRHSSNENSLVDALIEIAGALADESAQADRLPRA